MPILFAAIGVAFPFPFFSMHGGPAWFVYFFMFIFIVGFYMNRIFTVPKQNRLHYLGLNVISLVIFTALLGIAGTIVSNAVMSQ